MIKKSKAFTMAEVLITIGLIGALAIMILPSLKNNIEDRILTSQIKHAYSLISQAASSYMSENKLMDMRNVIDCSLTTCSGGEISLEKFVESTLKYSQKCENAGDCFYDSFLRGDDTINVSDHVGANGGGIAYILTDGYIIHLDKSSQNSNIRVTVDVNGETPPNEFGRDVWVMYIDRSGSVVPGTSGGSCSSNEEACFDAFVERGFKLSD